MKPIIDLHTHTISSGHAYSTLMENIEWAKKHGLKYYGISDHAPSMPGTAKPIYFRNLNIIHKEIDGVRILRGIEANILDYTGKIDIDEVFPEKLDYVIASLHSPCIIKGNKEDNTNALIGAMKNPYVKIIGHPDDSRYPLDYERLVKAAKEYDILLEMNNSSLGEISYRLNARENYMELLNLCKEYKVKIIFGSDAHICYEVGDFSSNIKLIEEIGFPKELIVNYSENPLIDLKIIE